MQTEYRRECRVCRRETVWRHTGRRHAALECAEHSALPPIEWREIPDADEDAPLPVFDLPAWAVDAIGLRDDERRRVWREECDELRDYERYRGLA